jgi:large subunit ribosomal protein L6
MSRIGKKPVAIPQGVQVNLKNHSIEVKGKLGTLSQVIHPRISVKQDGGNIVVERPDDTPSVRALHGLTRALIANMVTGVSAGFKRDLQIEGVGFRGEVQGNALVLSVGFSHTVRVEAPQGVAFAVDKTGRAVTISGIDKTAVGQTAANVRGVRKPEPYKGKGIRYSDEVVRRKAGKAGKVGSGGAK